MSEWTPVAAAADLAVGQVRIVDVDGTPVAVFNIGGEFYAVEDVCTHDGGELASGQVEGHSVICPRHGARFCLRSGAVEAPPAYEPIAVFPVRVDDGTVYVRDDRWD